MTAESHKMAWHGMALPTKDIVVRLIGLKWIMTILLFEVTLTRCSVSAPRQVVSYRRHRRIFNDAHSHIPLGRFWRGEWTRRPALGQELQRSAAEHF